MQVNSPATTAGNRAASGLPKTRSPYGRALEEAKGYEIETKALGEQAKKVQLPAPVSAAELGWASPEG
jgi:hypothetical protein